MNKTKVENKVEARKCVKEIPLQTRSWIIYSILNNICQQAILKNVFRVALSGLGACLIQNGEKEMFCSGQIISLGERESEKIRCCVIWAESEVE